MNLRLRGSQTAIVMLVLTSASTTLLGQALSGAEIQGALDRGRQITVKKFWGEVSKQQEISVKGRLHDPVFKRVIILSDRDRITMEAFEAKRQLREVTSTEIGQSVPLGFFDVMVEAYTYSPLYASNLVEWALQGRVHVVLRLDGEVVQPIGKQAAQPEYVLPLAPKMLTAAVVRSWFTFAAVGADHRKLPVTIISGTGKQVQIEMPNPLVQTEAVQTAPK